MNGLKEVLSQVPEGGPGAPARDTLKQDSLVRGRFGFWSGANFRRFEFQ